MRTSALVAGGLALGAAGVAVGIEPAGDYVRSVEVVKKVSAKNSNSQKDMYVACPEGKKAIGGGADVDSAFTGSGVNAVSVVALRTSQPSNGLLPIPESNSGPPTLGWQATAMETTPTTLKWTLTVHVICANVTDPGPQPQERTFSDIGVTKEHVADDSGVRPGGSVNYDVTVKNYGPDPDTGVVVTDTPDSNQTYDAGASDPACTESAGKVSCTVGALAVGASKTFRVVFTLSSEPGYPIENCAAAKGDNADAAGSNNEDCEEVYISE